MGRHARHDDHHQRVNDSHPWVSRALELAAADRTNSFISVESDPSPGPGPLAGVPIAVKDLIDHAGRTTTAGSGFYRKSATETAPALARLQRAGAAVIGRTNLHEFAFGFSSENPWFGPVLNPWDHALSPGGSSGGSAAAVAAGIVPIALGTDTGGSIRVPAALCAVVGLKVTHGLIPLEGVFPLVPSFDTVGAITITLDDLELATAIMAGDEWVDTTGGREAERVRLVAPEHWVDSAPLATDVREAFDGFLQAAADSGIEVRREELPVLGTSPHQAALIAREVAPIHRDWRRSGRPYGDDVGERVDHALTTAANPEAIAAADEWRSRITGAMVKATSDHTVVVTPAVAAMDKRIGDDQIGDHHYRTLLSWFSAPVNPTGCPALSVPVAGEGRRPSVQLIGGHRSEKWLLEVARLLERRGLVGVTRMSSE